MFLLPTLSISADRFYEMETIKLDVGGYQHGFGSNPKDCVKPPQPVPEPGTLLLISSGLSSLYFLKRKRK